MNSGAIDEKGNVYVWGAGKYGLLGNPKQKNPITKPIILTLKSQNLVLENENEQSFVATSISFGQYHAALVVNDQSTNSEFSQIQQDVLKQFAVFLKQKYEENKKKIEKEQRKLQSNTETDTKTTSQVSEDSMIEHSLKSLFSEQSKTFPYITVSSLKQVMIKKAGLKFDTNLQYNMLFQQLSQDVGNNTFMVNLKELRDQLVGRRCGNGVVFCWGLANDGRLGIDLTEEQTQAIKNDELKPVKPSIVKFPQPDIIIVKVACGSSFTIALSQAGLVYSWGLGSSGGLGQGQKSTCHRPEQIKFDKTGRNFQNIKDIACGSNHCLAADHGGPIYSWGNGQGGRLGHGDETGENLPKEIVFFRQNSIQTQIIEAGESNSALITPKNELYLWGVGLNGRLGTGKTVNLLSPTQIEDIKSVKVEDISLGSNHTLCVLRNGKVLCWGSSKDGKMGLEASLDRNFMIPKELITLDKEKIFQVSAGPFHSLALTENGSIYSFGNYKDGKLGFDEKQNVLIPRKLANGISFYKKYDQDSDNIQLQPKTATGVLAVSCGINSSIILLNDGSLYSCGSNKYGQLGLDDGSGEGEEGKEDNGEDNKVVSEEEGKGDDLIPAYLQKRINELEKQQDTYYPKFIEIRHESMQLKVRQVSAGSFHVLAVTTEGHCFGWGRNDSGQLGVGKKDHAIKKPTKIKFLTDERCVMVAAGETHSLFLFELGEVYSAGFNEFGELGIQQVIVNQDQDKGENNSPQDKDEDQERHTEYQQYLYDARIELSPILVKGLESIGFIAVGKNHSIAIKNSRRKEKGQQLYSWGCGWCGQTGHGTWANISEPKHLKISSQKDVKFTMASCGLKHTLALDTTGKLWFFGQLSSAGLGSLTTDEKQLVPIRLQPPKPDQDMIFKHISSGEDYNLVVGQNGKVYCLGKNQPYNRGEPVVPELVYFEPLEFHEKALQSACGPQHSIICDQSGLPYSWGNPQYGRCGIKNPEDENEEGNRQMTTHKTRFGITVDEINNLLVVPTILPVIQKLFSKGMNKDLEDKIRELKQHTGVFGVEGANGEPHSHKKIKDEFDELREQDPTLRFPIQKIFKEQKQSLDENNLINQDRNLEINFSRLIEEFHKTVREKNESRMDTYYNAQNAIISRVLTFPSSSQGGLGGIERLDNIKVELPKIIIRNKQVFEAIFQTLQIHPCYMINWITKTAINRSPREVVHVLQAVFGEKDMRNDTRIIHILMAIARKQFQYELRAFDLKEILWGRTESTFVQIFNLIFENQDQNKKFIMSLICFMLHKVQKFLPTFEIEENNRHKLVYTKADLPKLFDYDYFMQSNLDESQNRIKILIEFLNMCLTKIVKSLDPFYRTKESAFLSDEIFTLLSTIREDIVNFSKQGNNDENEDLEEEEIDCYINSLVFDILITKMREITSFEILKDYYWGFLRQKLEKRPVPHVEIFNIDQKEYKRNLIVLLTDNLEFYLKNKRFNYSNKAIDEFTEFITKSPFRREMSNLLNVKVINFDYMFLRDLFLNSMEMNNSNLTISINDLIMVYNNLIEFSDVILIPNHNEDPLGLLLSALGSQPIEIQRGERKLIADELLSLKLNLEIKCRLLLSHHNLARCADCYAPVHEDLLPAKRFKEGTQGMAWMCMKEGCTRYMNDRKSYRCGRCQGFRDEQSIPRDQMFVKYRRLINNEAVMVFMEILILVPILDTYQSIDKVLDFEIEVEEKQKKPDYQKQQTIERFRRMKQDYLQKNKMQSESDDQADLAKKKIENQYLSDLENLLIQYYKHIRGHEKLLQDYNRLIQEMSDKLTQTYGQKHLEICQEFKAIANNAFHGRGSEFLRDFEKQEILAGKLHILLGGKKGSSNSQQKEQANPKLQQFFLDLDKKPKEEIKLEDEDLDEAELPPEVEEKKEAPKSEAFKNNFGFYAKYPLYKLQERKILINVQIEGKKLDMILKKSSYVFIDDLDLGFKVELIFEGIPIFFHFLLDAQNKCLFFGLHTNEAVLETFNIDKHLLAELRRTYSTKAIIKLGGSEFNVFELVFLLNEIKSKIYSYGVARNEVKGPQKQQGNKGMAAVEKSSKSNEEQKGTDKGKKDDKKKDDKKKEEPKKDDKKKEETKNEKGKPDAKKKDNKV